MSYNFEKNLFWYKKANKEMGFQYPVFDYPQEVDVDELYKSLHYDLSYSQGDYAYIAGWYDLGVLLPEIKEKLKRLADYFIQNEKEVRKWLGFCDYISLWNVDFDSNGFYVKRENTPSRWEVDDTIKFFVRDLERKIVPKASIRVRRLINSILIVLKSKKLSEMFDHFEYKLMQDLYSEYEAWKKENEDDEEYEEEYEYDEED